MESSISFWEKKGIFLNASNVTKETNASFVDDSFLHKSSFRGPSTTFAFPDSKKLFVFLI